MSAIDCNDGSQARVLWIKADALHPPNSGGRIRTLNMLKVMSKTHDIDYVALLPRENAAEAQREASIYAKNHHWIDWTNPPRRGLGFLLSILRNLLFSRFPFVIDKYYSPLAEEKIGSLFRSNTYNVIVCDFPFMFRNLPERSASPAPAIIFQHNVESQIWRRHKENASNPFYRWYLNLQFRRFADIEREICDYFDGVITVSESDSDHFQSELGVTNILGDVSAGVDTDFFTPQFDRKPSRKLVFVGSMDWMPNVDAMEFFCAEVFPTLKTLVDDVELTIVGRNPTQRVLDLASIDGVTVTGTVDDVRPYLAEAAISIVPLRIGGGTRIKIFECMATAIPVLSTTIGAEGLPVKHDENIVIADDVDSLVNSIANLLNNPEKQAKVGRAGHGLVVSSYGWAQAVQKFTDLCLMQGRDNSCDNNSQYTAKKNKERIHED